MRIGVDIDEVLTPFTEVYLPFFNKRHGKHLKVSDFVHYEFHEIAGVPLADCVETCRIWAEEEGNTAKMRPYPDARRALEDLKAQGHELFVVSGRHSFSHETTKRWLDEHFPGVFSDVFFISFRGISGDKTTKADVCVRHGITVLVDDDPHYVEQCCKAGVELIMPAQPWNKSVKSGPGVHKARGWEQVASIVARL